jgi:hypothetical protein
MSFNSTATSSFCCKVEGEVVGSSPIGRVCNLSIKKKERKTRVVVDAVYWG